MPRTVKTAAALAGLILAAVTLTACFAPKAEPVASPTAEAKATRAPEPSVETPEPSAEPEPIDCAVNPSARINLPGYEANTRPVDAPELAGEVTDTGVREYAVGEPTLNAEGQIHSYTVQPGDALEAIATRFCIDSSSLGTYNKKIGWDLKTGDVLVFRPAPGEDWAPQTLEEAVAVSCAAGYKNGIDMSSGPARVFGYVADFGATPGANGTVNRNAAGEIESCTVAAGDELSAVADRFCFEVESLATYNKVSQAITAGMVLVLSPPFDG